MTKMTAFGMKSTEKEYALVLDFLVKNYPAEEVPRINVNKATAIELESGLSQPAALAGGGAAGVPRSKWEFQIHRRPLESADDRCGKDPGQERPDRILAAPRRSCRRCCVPDAARRRGRRRRTWSTCRTRAPET
jgi:hypothetical protein